MSSEKKPKLKETSCQRQQILFFISVREIKEALDDDYDDNDTDTILNSTCHAQLLLCATPLLTLNCKYKLATTVYYNYYS
jgi:hypothetical protein